MNHLRFRTRSSPPHQLYHAPALLVAAVVLLACNTAPHDESTGSTAAAPRPAAIQDTISLEGMAEPITARLVTLSEFATPFSTYVPDGIESQVEQVGDSGSVRFTAAFTGRTAPNAYMHVRLYPTGTDLSSAREEIAMFLRSRRPQDDPLGRIDVPETQQQVSPPDWGVHAHVYSYEGDGAVPYTGRIILGRYEGRYFHVLTHYPAEYADGLGPRFDYMLRQWRWEETGEMLGG